MGVWKRLKEGHKNDWVTRRSSIKPFAGENTGAKISLTAALITNNDNKVNRGLMLAQEKQPTKHNSVSKESCNILL